MLRKIFLSIIIFSICSCSYYRTKHITKQKQWEDYLPGGVVKATVKAKRYNEAIEDGKIEPKRKPGEEWVDLNGQKWKQNKEYKIKVFDQKIQTYTGWWVYGEGQHIFKDEAALEEFDLIFPNENMVELVALYLSVCEMEYFPMECIMQGHLQNDTLEVTDFEITYIQGCGE